MYTIHSLSSQHIQYILCSVEYDIIRLLLHNEYWDARDHDLCILMDYYIAGYYIQYSTINTNMNNSKISIGKDQEITKKSNSKHMIARWIWLSYTVIHIHICI